MRQQWSEPEEKNDGGHTEEVPREKFHHGLQSDVLAPHKTKYAGAIFQIGLRSRRNEWWADSIPMQEGWHGSRWRRMKMSLPLAAICALAILSPLLKAADGAAAPEIAPFPKALVQSVWVQSIWADGRHNGFPGIARVGDYYYVTFRTGESHGSPTSKIIVIRANAKDLKAWDKVAEFTHDHDCRDPLVFDNHGKVEVVFHSQEDFYSMSSDGLNWSEPKELDTEFAQPRADSKLTFTSQRRWLFRIRQGPDGAFYSLGRCGIIAKGAGKFGLITYRSEDGVTFKALHTYAEGPTSALPQAGGSGWGHEADLAWTPDGTMVSAIRNSNPGVVVMGKAPLGPWKAFPTDAWNFGGPALHQTKGGGILLAARSLPEKDPPGFPSVCKVWTVTANGVEKPWIIPSGGDGAYQSFASGTRDDEVLLVYYSSHEYLQQKGVGNNPTNIYLAHLRIRHAPP